jgi:hypothetical protein
MQTICLPQFLSIYRYWCNNVNTTSNATQDYQNEGIRTAVELSLQDCSTLLELIVGKLLQCRRRAQVLNVDMLREKLLSDGCYFEEEQLENLFDVFLKYSLLSNDGFINLKLIHEIFKPENMPKDVSKRDSKLLYSITSRLRVLYEPLKEVLLRVKGVVAVADTISEEEFTSAIKICGLIISRGDAHMLWRHLISLAYPSAMMTTAVPNKLAIADLHCALFQPGQEAAPYSFDSPNMQQHDLNLRRLRKPIASTGAVAGTNPMDSVFKDACYHEREVAATPTSTSTPTTGRRHGVLKYDDEAESGGQSQKVRNTTVTTLPVSNLQSRVMKRLAELPQEQVLSYFEYLQRHCSQSSSKQAPVITRSVMTEALALQGIHMSRSQAEELWATLLNVGRTEGPRESAIGFHSRRREASDYLTLEDCLAALGLLGRFRMFTAASSLSPVDSKLLQSKDDAKYNKTLADYLPPPSSSHEMHSEENKVASTDAVSTSAPTVAVSSPMDTDIGQKPKGVQEVVSSKLFIPTDVVPSATMRTEVALPRGASGESSDPPTAHIHTQATTPSPTLPPRSSVLVNDSFSRRLRKAASPVKTTSLANHATSYSMADILSMQPDDTGDSIHNRSNKYESITTLGKGRGVYSVRPATALFYFGVAERCLDLDDDDALLIGNRLAANNDYILREQLKAKLQASSSVRGEKFRLLALAPVLRMRLRRGLETGKGVTQWDGVPDVCSVSDLSRVLEVINVNITRDEAAFIAKECSSKKSGCHYDTNTSSADTAANLAAVKDRGKQSGNSSSMTATTATEMGLKLSAAILYMSDLL